MSCINFCPRMNCCHVHIHILVFVHHLPAVATVVVQPWIRNILRSKQPVATGSMVLGKPFGIAGEGRSQSTRPLRRVTHWQILSLMNDFLFLTQDYLTGLQVLFLKGSCHQKKLYKWALVKSATMKLKLKIFCVKKFEKITIFKWFCSEIGSWNYIGGCLTCNVKFFSRIFQNDFKFLLEKRHPWLCQALECVK